MMFEDALNDLEKASTSLTDILDCSSEKMKILEIRLRNANLNIAFRICAFQENGIKYYLCWDIDSVSKSFRIMYLEINNETISINKPLQECKLEVRLKMARYLMPFMIGFTKFLIEYKEGLHRLKENIYSE